MGGLIVLGILALVGVLLFWVPRQRAQQEAAVTQTIQAMTQVAAAWTPTFTAVPTQPLPTWTPTTRPTWTAIPTATATRVLGEATPAATATPTSSALADWGAPLNGGETGTKPGATTPPTGLGTFGMGAIAVGLAGLVIVMRKLRSGS
jgi:type II secretory pathway pseudopilin PulG